LYTSVFDPAIREAGDRYQQGLGFSALHLCDTCEEALARYLGKSIDELRRARVAPPRPHEGRGPKRSPESTVPPAPASSAPPCDSRSGRRNHAAVNGADNRSTGTP